MKSYQNYTGCNNNQYLESDEQQFYLSVDTENPIVSCGFHDIHVDSNGYNDPFLYVEGNSLYHRVTKEMINKSSLVISSFWFKVTVSGCIILE